MASKRRLRRKACEGKVRHLDLASAWEAARVAAQRSGDIIHAYRCQHCGGFHIGHAGGELARTIQAKRGLEP